MDFNAFPIDVQHNIIRNMDLQSYFKTAMTSKGMLAIAQTCRDKYWDVDLKGNGSNDLYYAYLDYSVAEIRNMETFRLLFHKATVRGFYPFNPLPHDIDLRCKSLNFTIRQATISLLDRHKPTEKYDWLEVREFAAGETVELFSWLNASVISLNAHINAKQPEYLQLKVPRMWLQMFGNPVVPRWAYARMIVEEWIKGEREVRWIVARSTPLVFDTANNEVHRSFFEQYPKLIVSRTEHRQNLYRIRRHDGEVLIVRLPDRYNRVEIITPMEFQISGGGEDGAYDKTAAVKEFVHCRR